jgi:hypothetical protein|eukprot:Tamp_09524.p3 GENE.Tamp_09524~~Tamp_09524.p3  ORF type:complete len:158 (-),score=25.86 Tamp_09524:39-512(-)
MQTGIWSCVHACRHALTDLRWTRARMAGVSRRDEDADVSLAVALSLSLAEQEAAGASTRATDARELGQTRPSAIETRPSAIEDADARQLKAAIAASLAAHAGGAAGQAAPAHSMPSASEGGVVETGVATRYNDRDRQHQQLPTPSAPSPPPPPPPPP